MPQWSGELLVAGCLRPWAERLLDIVHAGPGENCVDVLSEGDVIAALLRRATAPGGTVRRVGTDAAPLLKSAGEVDVVVSLFGVAHVTEPAAWLVAMHRALTGGGRLAGVVWGGHAGAPHEAAVLYAIEQTTSLRPPYIESATALGEPGRMERIVEAAEMRHAVRVRRLRDVVRFDGIDQLWTALVDQRPQVGAALAACSPEMYARAKQICAERLVRCTAADGSLRIPVTGVVVST